MKIVLSQTYFFGRPCMRLSAFVAASLCLSCLARHAITKALHAAPMNTIRTTESPSTRSLFLVSSSSGASGLLCNYQLQTNPCVFCILDHDLFHDLQLEHFPRLRSKWPNKTRWVIAVGFLERHKKRLGFAVCDCLHETGATKRAKVRQEVGKTANGSDLSHLLTLPLLQPWQQGVEGNVSHSNVFHAPSRNAFHFILDLDLHEAVVLHPLR